jgi:hypothetical protein
MTRLVWAVALALLAIAVAAALWRPSVVRARPDPAGGGTPVASVCPMPPAQPAPASAPAAGTSALDDLLGGSLLAGGAAPQAAAPEVTVGAPARIERVDDRTIRVDDRFTIRGSGTEADPYQVSWEMLASSAQGVDAAAGRYEIPGRIADLRGAWIRISGYWAPPLQVLETREAMVMLNKWDGCCIGLPPTPFDSIEASFAQPLAVKGKHLFRFGTFKGRLSVEPFAAGTFLLGMYRLQDAVLETSS